MLKKKKRRERKRKFFGPMEASGGEAGSGGSGRGVIWDRRRNLGATLGSTYKPLLVKLAGSDRRRESPRLNLTASLTHQDPPIIHLYFVSKIPTKCLKKCPKKREKRTKIGPNKCINYNKISISSSFSHTHTPSTTERTGAITFTASASATATSHFTRTFIATTTTSTRRLLSLSLIHI